MRYKLQFRFMIWMIESVILILGKHCTGCEPLIEKGDKLVSDIEKEIVRGNYM